MSSALPVMASASWIDHWALLRDPFALPRSVHVPLADHEDAINRLSYVIESGERLGILHGETGVGKSWVLNRLAQRLRSARRRFARSERPMGGADLFSRLAKSLGNSGRFPTSPAPTLTRVNAWKHLETAVRLQTRQGLQVVLIVDGCEDVLDVDGQSDLRRLLSLGSMTQTPVSLLLTAEDGLAIRNVPGFGEAIPARLRPMTLSETKHYLTSMLADAGRTDEVFSPSALNRLHAASGGFPRRIDRLASTCLIAGAARQRETISEEIVERVERELGWPEPRVGLDSEPRFVLA